MARYHINSDGEAGACRAVEGNCPFSSEDEHFTSLDAARKFYENKMSSEAPFLSFPDDPISGMLGTKNGGVVRKEERDAAKKLDMRDFLRLIAKGEKFPLEKIPEKLELEEKAPGNVVPEAGKLYWDPVNKRMLKMGFDGTGFENLLTGRQISTVGAARAIKNVFFVSGKFVYDEENASKLQKEEVLKREENKKRWAREREKFYFDLKLAPNPIPSKYWYPESAYDDDPASSRLYGLVSVLGSYNKKIRELKEKPGTVEEKIESVLSERKKILNILQNHISRENSQKDVVLDIESLVFKVKSLFKMEATPPDLKERENAISERKKSAAEFARWVLEVPYMAEINLDFKDK